MEPGTNPRDGVSRTHAVNDPAAALPFLNQALDQSMRGREGQLRVVLADVHQALDDDDAALAQLDLAATGYADLNDPLADEIRTRATDLRRRLSTARPATTAQIR